MFNEYPYNNFSDLNLDYILKEIKRLNDIIEKTFTGDLADYLNKLMPEVLYDADNERITLRLKEKIVVKDGTHVYDPESKTIIIKEEK